MSDDLIQIVDENDNPVGAATRKETWAQGLRHRIVFVVLLDSSGRMLLQKRAKTMRLHPGRWTVSASGHVDAGEDYDSAAARELAEELGLKDVHLDVVNTFKDDMILEGKLLNRFCRVYKAVVPADITSQTQASEVERVQWFSPDEVRCLAATLEDIAPVAAKIITEYFPQEDSRAIR